MTMRTEYLVETVDTHTAGEPTRILTGGVDWQARGQTVDEQMERFEATHDDVRRMLMNEPRGHADMFGAVPVEPSVPDADLGVFYITPYGYGDMCGHANIGLVTAFVETGRLPATGSIRLETPVDVVDVRPKVTDGRVEQVRMENVDSFVFDQVTVDVPDHGPVAVEIVYSGIFFVMVDVAQLEPDFARANVDRLSSLALRIRDAVIDAVDITNPFTGAAARVIDTQFYERGDPERSLVVYPDGSVDRSPCGTGTCAKATLFAEWGELDEGESFVNRSLLDTEFEGRVVERFERDGVAVTTPAVAGSAHIVAKTTHTLDPADPLVGFSI